MFQSTRPRGARRTGWPSDDARPMFQSTRPRGARHLFRHVGHCRRGFNPRARAGRDLHGTVGRVTATGFNPRAPLTMLCTDFGVSFNPRAPRGARRDDLGGITAAPGVSIHAPRAGRDEDAWEMSDDEGVSIHAPRAGRDVLQRGNTYAAFVSIHAPRAGRDGGRDNRQRFLSSFNPRAPRGARR